MAWLCARPSIRLSLRCGFTYGLRSYASDLYYLIYHGACNRLLHKKVLVKRGRFCIIQPWFKWLLAYQVILSLFFHYFRFQVYIKLVNNLPLASSLYCINELMGVCFLKKIAKKVSCFDYTNNPFQGAIIPYLLDFKIMRHCA